MEEKDVRTILIPIGGVTRCICSTSIKFTILPKGTIIELCPMLGCLDKQIINTNDKLIFHPSNLDFILSHCSEKNIIQMDAIELDENGVVKNIIEKQRKELEFLVNIMK